MFATLEATELATWVSGLTMGVSHHVEPARDGACRRGLAFSRCATCRC